MRGKLESMQDQMHRVEAALTRVETMVRSTVQAKTVKEKQRLKYNSEKALRERGKLKLPSFHILERRDARLSGKTAGWAEVGMRFGALDQPEQFLTWVVYKWNACCYLKKPITYSGGYYRVHTGEIRCNYGAFDLMGYNAKQSIFIKNDGQLVDFCNRPWWNWAYNVLYPVYTTMQELPGFRNLPERFTRGVRLILGGCGEYEVYTELCWDQNETRFQINKMLKRVGVDLRSMWRACCDGLRHKAEPASPTIPS